MKFLRPNHENKIPATNQSESSRCHAQPVVKHPVVLNGLCPQALQGLCRR